MTQTTHPDKQKVRDWMNRPREERAKVQTPERIREELGWNLLPHNKVLQPR